MDDVLLVLRPCRSRRECRGIRDSRNSLEPSIRSVHSSLPPPPPPSPPSSPSSPTAYIFLTYVPFLQFLKSCDEYFVVNDMKQVFLREGSDSEEPRKPSPLLTSQNQDKDFESAKSTQEMTVEAADSQYQERETECETTATCASTVTTVCDPGSEAISCEVGPLDVGGAVSGLLELPMDVVADGDGAKVGGDSVDKADGSTARMEGSDPGSHDVAMEETVVGGTRRMGSGRKTKE